MWTLLKSLKIFACNNFISFQLKAYVSSSIAIPVNNTLSFLCLIHIIFPQRWKSLSKGKKEDMNKTTTLTIAILNDIWCLERWITVENN